MTTEHDHIEILKDKTRRTSIPDIQLQLYMFFFIENMKTFQNIKLQNPNTIAYVADDDQDFNWICIRNF